MKFNTVFFSRARSTDGPVSARDSEGSLQTMNSHLRALCIFGALYALTVLLAKTWSDPLSPSSRQATAVFSLKDKWNPRHQKT